MSRLVARLEAAGSSSASDDPADGRACRIRLTAAGVDAQRGVGLRHGRHVAQIMTRAFSAEQLEQLRDLCRETASPKASDTMKRLVVVSAGTGNPSSTRLLADRIAPEEPRPASSAGTTASSVIELGPLAVDIARAAVAGFPGERAPGGDRAGSPPPTRSSPPPPSTRPGSAGCSSRSSTSSTTT